MNTRDQRIAEYLAKAEAAEERAEQTPDSFLRECWLRVAASYRDMAKTT